MVDPSCVKFVVGKGGSNVAFLRDKYQVSLDIKRDNSGRIVISGVLQTNVDAAAEYILNLLEDLVCPRRTVCRSGLLIHLAGVFHNF